MEPLALEPGNYSGTYKLIGEEICFDFINTISWPGAEREHDWLDRPENFIRWAVASGIISKGIAKSLAATPKAKLEKEMDYIRSVRRQLSNALIPLAFKKNLAGEPVKYVNALIHQIYSQRTIDFRTRKWVWKDPVSLSEALAPVIWNAGHVLTEIDHARISHCPSCHWIFYDNTKNRSRRWCDMNDCGSRDKSLRYYHRLK